MKQLELFLLPPNFNVINEWVPRFKPSTMDGLARLDAMNWRRELEIRNFNLKYKGKFYDNKN